MYRKQNERHRSEDFIIEEFNEVEGHGSLWLIHSIPLAMEKRKKTSGN